jgi:signal transduction histidine kinase
MVDAPIAGLLIAKRQRRIAYVMAFALFVVISTLFTLSSWQNVVEEDDRELSMLATLGSEAVDVYFLTLQKALANLGEILERDGISAQSGETLRTHKDKYPEFSLFLVTNLEGEILASSRRLVRGGMIRPVEEPSFRESREKLIQGKTMDVGRAFTGPLTNSWIIPLRYGVRDKQGKLILILTAGLSQEHTYAFWKNVPLLPGATMAIFDGNFYVVAQYPPVTEISDKMQAGPFQGLLPDFVRNHGSEKSGIVRGFSTLRNIRIGIAYKRLTNYGLTFDVANPESNLYPRWWKSAWPTYALLTLLFLGGIFIIRWVARRQGEMQLERENRVTELEAISARLNASNAELEGFMYSISHDFRAPIRAINGFASLLQGKLGTAPHNELINYLGRIIANANRMGGLLEDLLNLSRYSTQDLGKVELDMQAEVRPVISELSNESNGVKFEIGELPPGRGDPILIRQVWINLIANAVKYSSKSPAPVVHIGFESGAYYVEDNGIGFDMTYAEKLFKLFSRLHADNEYSGTGVGLAIVKRIVERHGGLVEARGIVGSGARFSFTLPG